jgi:diacylglycerol O-acyltransferase
MAVTSPQVLTRADAAWLHAEAPTNPFVVTSLAILDTPPSVERLKLMFSNRLSLHPRLRQVVSETGFPLAKSRWVPAQHFDLDAHIHHVALPQPAGLKELSDLIGDLAGQPLDFGRPMWSVHAVDGPGEGGALVCRFHHSLGDGQAMVRMLQTLTDETRGGWRRPQPGTRRQARPRAHPAQPWSAPELVRKAIDCAATVARLTLLDPDRATSLRGELSLLKAVAWTRPVPLALIKHVAGVSGTTVNDVVVSAVAGGLGAHLRRSGVDTRGLRIRAMVPVNLRPKDDAGMSGNRFSLVFLELPVGVTGPRERLMRVKVEMDRIKASMEPTAGWLLLQGLGFMPEEVERLAASFYGGKASVVLTNVIGPARRRYLAGSEIRQMTFWEPEAGGLGVGVSVFSYAGEITVGVVSDRNILAAPEQLTADIAEALIVLSKVVS